MNFKWPLFKFMIKMTGRPSRLIDCRKPKRGLRADSLLKRGEVIKVLFYPWFTFFWETCIANRNTSSAIKIEEFSLICLTLFSIFFWFKRPGRLLIAFIKISRGHKTLIKYLFLGKQIKLKEFSFICFVLFSIIIPFKRPRRLFNCLY